MQGVTARVGGFTVALASCGWPQAGRRGLGGVSCLTDGGWEDLPRACTRRKAVRGRCSVHAWPWRC